MKIINFGISVHVKVHSYTNKALIFYFLCPDWYWYIPNTHAYQHQSNLVSVSDPHLNYYQQTTILGWNECLLWKGDMVKV